MSKNPPRRSDWLDQEDAFFSDTCTIASLGASSTNAVVTPSDLEDATLPSTYLCESVNVRRRPELGGRTYSATIESDAQLARRLMEEERRKDESIEADERFARMLMEQQSDDGDDRKIAAAPSGDDQYARSIQRQEEQAAAATTTNNRRQRMNNGQSPTSQRNNGQLPTSTNRNNSKMICPMCNERPTYFIKAHDTVYHPKCFKCIACFKVIKANEPYATSTDSDTGITSPYHRDCYTKLFGKRCVICEESIPSNKDGSMPYHRHPFFTEEKMCPRHLYEDRRRCTGCHRFEPDREKFADLGDAGRCVCNACCRSVIVDSVDARPLWDRVLRFLEDGLGLTIWEGMREVPVLIVGHAALNDQLNRAGGGHGTGNGGGSSGQPLTRGLCLSEHERGRRFEVPRYRFSRKHQSFIPNDDESIGHSIVQVPQKSEYTNSSVTAILCLSGLPSDLTASILAHEATHAWIKLNPHYRKALPQQVEEGCCQLVAMLLLTDGLDPLPEEEEGKEGDGPSNLKLRQFFKYSIESDTDEIYGVGYKKAARAYAEIGLEPLLDFIVVNQSFPTLG